MGIVRDAEATQHEKLLAGGFPFYLVVKKTLDHSHHSVAGKELTGAGVSRAGAEAGVDGGVLDVSTMGY